MPENHPYLLGSVNVVITANNHNPLFIDPNALASKEIVPTDWTVLEAGTTPEASLVRYANGVKWLIDQSRLQISESCDHSFKDDYLIYGLADAYLEKVHAPYQNLGLNYLVTFAQDNPRQWLIERFVPSYLRSKNNIDVFAMLPRMFFNMGSTLRSICKLEINIGNTQRKNDNDAIEININIDHGGPLNADNMRAAIGLWKEKQEFLISTLDAIFKEP